MLLVQVRTRRWVNVCVCLYRSVTNYRTHSTYLYVPLEKNCVYQRMSDTTVVNHTAVVSVCVHGTGDGIGLLILMLHLNVMPSCQLYMG